MFRLEIVSEPARFRALADDWTRLHRACGATVFSHHALLVAKIETSVERRRALHAVVLWQGERMVGAACLAKRRERIGRRLPIRAMKLTFLDQFDIGSNDILLDPHVPGVAEAMARTVYEMPDVAIVDIFPLSPHAGGPAFLAAVRAAGRMLAEREEMQSSLVDLTGGPSAFLARRSAKTRETLRKKMRRAEAAGFEFVRARGGEKSAHMVLAEALEMSFKSWKAAFGTNIGARAEERGFLHRLVAFPPAGCTLCVDTLRKDGVAVAFAITLHHNGRAYGLITDYDAAYSKESLGLVACVQAIFDAAEAGCDTFDTLRLTSLSESIGDRTEVLKRCHIRSRWNMAAGVILLEGLMRRVKDRAGPRAKRLTGRRKFLSSGVAEQ
ncbi:GNAT family N-acetyltransferase [uncultured Maritimibacter sp.]|jgi:CelD/BcsL family acetyltransferase involved in cellulose biosynthesis|uniref:GNAT family N-acetyltransferase n=1 Tax=uncultured Maritimibacter sp. TaxID=991866 RepID=UPI00261BF3B3|nr:GNAT family N-acetyltransferase [uncultured Maritimibacter sp.]